MVALSAFTPELATSSDATPNQVLCLVRALRVYVDRTAQFRQSEQLFVCFGGSTKGQPVFKQRLSNWVVKAIVICLGIFEPGNGMSYWCQSPFDKGGCLLMGVD